MSRLTNPPIPPETELRGSVEVNRPERSLNRVDRHVGTTIHLALELLSQLTALPQQLPLPIRQQLELSLKMLGLWGLTLQQAMTRVEEAVARTLGDAQGRWVLSVNHDEAYSELPLTRAHEGTVIDVVIDRTFVDTESGERWVVDYKNSTPAPGVPVEEFIREESLRYREQLRGYRDSMAEYGPQPVRCALYFTSLALLHPVSELTA